VNALTAAFSASYFSVSSANACSDSLQRSTAHEIEGTVALFGLVNIDEVAGLLPAR
jgi:hypothetical protein